MSVHLVRAFMGRVSTKKMGLSVIVHLGMVVQSVTTIWMSVCPTHVKMEDSVVMK